MRFGVGGEAESGGGEAAGSVTVSFVVAGNEVPETRFASFGEDRIAYQLLGDGPVDLVLCPSSGECFDV
jgi:hypothetical protein